MEKNKTIMKLCYLQTTFYIVFLTALITRHRRGISQKTFAFLIILSLVGCAVSLTLGDYIRNMIRSSGFDVAGVHDKKSLEKKLQQLQNADDTLNVGVMMFDLNNLKYFNDTHGHATGDYYIIVCSEIIQDIFGMYGKVYRIGGDEFCAVTEGVTEEEFMELRRGMNDRIEALNGRFFENKMSVASGYAAYDKKSDHDIHDTIKRADQKMYECKAAMKGR